MASRAVGRFGGLAAGLVVGVILAGGASLLSARPPDRPTADVHVQSLKIASGTDSISAYIAYPERTDPAPALLVIHDLGMSDFERDATKRLAQTGYVVIAPDLLSRQGGTPATPDSARKLLASLNPDAITQDLDAAAAYVRGLKAVDSTKVGVIGFGWGGGETIRYAIHNQSLRVFVVCYGPLPKGVFDFKRIKAAGLGVYADRDGRVTQGLYNMVKDMQKVDVDYIFKIYPNTGHGFLRTGQPANATAEAWQDISTFLKVWFSKD